MTRVYIIYDKHGNKHITKHNKTGLWYNLCDAKKGLRLSLNSINKKSKKKVSEIKGRHMLEHYNDYVIKEFELVEKGIHKV